MSRKLRGYGLRARTVDYKRRGVKKSLNSQLKNGVRLSNVYKKRLRGSLLTGMRLPSLKSQEVSKEETGLQDVSIHNATL